MSQTVWDWISHRFSDTEGVAYYKYPVVRASSGSIPDLTIVTRSFVPLAVRCLAYSVDDISEISDETWIVRGHEIDSPLLELDDFVVGLKSALDRERALRRLLSPLAVLAVPLIPKHEFVKRFGIPDTDHTVIWTDQDTTDIRRDLERELTDDEWRLTRAILQGVRPLSGTYGRKSVERASTLGDAIAESEKRIALFDFEQEKAAIPLPPGPQRVRGLAGTGKTVLLAMKAANIHKHYPDKRILFTFNTQSLYNQAKSLITKFFRYHMDVDPNWDVLHIRHGWGGRSRPGVYSDLCANQGTKPLDFSEARKLNQRSPFQACCHAALSSRISPTYDFVLVDEAQDFPKEYFRVLYKLAHPPHRIYWTYDELQSLFSLEMPRSEELFGIDDSGSPLVSLEGEDYPGGIEKDLVLHKAYRCTHPVLMLAHAIGLGLYSKSGCVQILQDRESWEAIGYVIEEGNLIRGEKVVIYRPPENSPSHLLDVYDGAEDSIRVEAFSSREDEINWIASSISNDIKLEQVKPEHIIVIALDSFEAKNNMAALQFRLESLGIHSTIPGLIDDTSAFAEPDKVTLTTVFKAKGNEAPIVYIMSFEALNDFVERIERRNMAFTAISRAKMLVRISGIGKAMEEAKDEVLRIRADHPRFVFSYPDIEAIRRLDAETSKRRRAVQKAKDAAAELTKLDPQAIAALEKADPNLFEKLIQRIEEAKRDNQ